MTHFKWCVQFLSVDNCGINLHNWRPLHFKGNGEDPNPHGWAFAHPRIGLSGFMFWVPLSHIIHLKKKKNCLFKKRPPTLVPAPRVWFWKLINELEKNNELAFWVTLLLTLSSPVLFIVLVKSIFLSLLSCSLFSLVFIIESPEFSPLIPISN